MDIKFYEVFADEQKQLEKFLPGTVKAEYTEKTVQESGDREPPSALISIRTQSQIPSEWAAALKGVLSRSQGYDHLTKFGQENGNGVQLGYLDSYCARAVAEQAMLAAMALMRKLKQQIAQLPSFHREGLTGMECRGRNVFVAGVGNIGTEAVRIARGLEMNVKGFDIDPRIKDLEYVSLESGLAWADVLICALPLTDETRDMLSYDVLSKAKRGLIYVNISRGEISPVTGLKKLLEEEVLAGLSMDVFPNEAHLAHKLRGAKEAMDKESDGIKELAAWENVIFTPHNAFNTQEALEHKASFSAGAATYFLQHGMFPTTVPSV